MTHVSNVQKYIEIKGYTIYTIYTIDTIFQNALFENENHSNISN